MGAFKNTTSIISKRPFVLVLFGLLLLLYYAISSPITSVASGFLSLGSGNILENIVSVLQIMLNPAVAFGGLLLLVAFALITSILLGFALSGYMNIVNNALDGKPKLKGEFMLGVRKYFFKITTVNFRAILTGALLMLFLAVCSVPAAVVTRALTVQKPSVLLMGALVDIVTLLIIFFCLMFYSIYTSFWYPALINHEEKAFSTGKRTADTYFWGLIVRYLALGLLFVGVEYVLGKVSHSLSGNLSILVLIVNWLFSTFFFVIFTTYVLAAYKVLRGKIKV